MASYRRIASDGDYGFNRNEANKRKQYAKATTAVSSDDDVDIDRINCFSSYFNNIAKKWRDSGEYHVMVDSDWQKAIDLSKLVYDVTSPVPMKMPSVMARTGSVLSANICSFAIEEKCAIFLGMPEKVSLVKKMMTVYTKTPESATLLYRSTVFDEAMSSRKEEKVIITPDMVEERFKSHVTRPFRPSLFERFGTTAFKAEICASNGAFSTLSASNTHAKALVHFTRVACGRMRNSLDVVSGLEEKEEERSSVARSLLKEFVSPHLDGDDAAILYGNATDRRAFAQLVENEPLNHGIIPEQFTRDMERTPYVEIDHGSSGAITVYSDRFATNEHGNVVKSRKPVSLKVNIGQLLCDMIFGSDWDIHLKDYLSLLGYETFFDRDDSLKDRLKKLLLDKRRTDLGDLAQVMVSRYIKKVSNAEFDRLLASSSSSNYDEDPITPTTVADYIRLVVRHIYFDVFYTSGLKNICTRLSENYQTPVETVDGELEEVTGNLFLSRIVDSLHLLRNQDLSRVCYNIDVSVSSDKEDDFKRDTASNRVTMQVFEDDIPEDTLEVFDGKVGKCDNITISWDATYRRVIAVSKSIKLLDDDDDETVSDTAAKSSWLLLKEIEERLKRDTPPSRFFNYRAMYDAVKCVLKEDDSPIPNRFTDSSSFFSPCNSSSSSGGMGRRAGAITLGGFFFSGLRDALETGLLRGASRDVESTLMAMSEDTKVLPAARVEEVNLRDSISTALTKETTAERLIMRENAHGIEFKDSSGVSALETLRDLRSNKIKFSEAMEKFGITTDPSMDRDFARDMESAYPDGAIDRWKRNVDAVRDDLPASQISKLDDIERIIKESKLSDQEVVDKINDTELSKAIDSILKRSLGGGSKIFVGRFVAIAITGSVIGMLGKATADVRRASRGVHYNVHDASSGDLKSFKITRFSCTDPSSYVSRHYFAMNSAAGSYEDGSHSNFKANPPICREDDGLCGRWTSSVLPRVKPMRVLVRGTSLTCDSGLTVTQAASEVLGTAASNIIGKIIEVKGAAAEVTTPGIFDLIKYAFTFGVPVAAGLTSTGLSFANWKKGLGVALAVFVLILFVRFFVGSGFLTIKWFGVDMGDERKRKSAAFRSKYTSADEERISRLLFPSSVKNKQKQKEKKEDEDAAGKSNQKLRNFEIIRPLFGPARPTQEMTYFYVGLLY